MDLKAARVLFMDQRVIDELPDDQQSLVLEKLNAHNPKLNIGRILPFPRSPLFSPGLTSFSIVERADSMRFALVAQACGEVPERPLAPDEAAVLAKDESTALYRAMLYLFVSPIESTGRNVFVTQTVFPGLCALLEEMKAAPGIAFSSHPVYFLDLASGVMPDSVRRTLKLFTAMGVGYVSVYRADFDRATVPRELEALLHEIGDQRSGRLYYSVDPANRTLKFEQSQFVPGGLLDAGATPANWNFKGSSDKFYWAEVLPVAVVAAHSGFQIDYSDMVSYLDGVRASSGGVKMSIKFDRTVAIFKYIEKLSKLNR